jgi:membrane-associated phospholipid phosphatase
MRRNALLWFHLGLGAMLAALGLLWLDPALAGWVRDSGVEGAWLFANGTYALDLVLGRDASQFLLGGALLLAGAVLCARPAARNAGRALLYVGNVQLFATVLTGVLKTVFGRLRPHEVLAAGPGDAWFAGGDSFPSGHAGFYFGLVLPVVALWPRRAWPLLALPWFIAVARVVGNDHYLGDVGASIAIAAGLALALWPIAPPPAPAR